MKRVLSRASQVPVGSSMAEEEDQAVFLQTTYALTSGGPQYMSGGEDINSLELAHLNLM